MRALQVRTCLQPEPCHPRYVQVANHTRKRAFKHRPALSGAPKPTEISLVLAQQIGRRMPSIRNPVAQIAAST